MRDNKNFLGTEPVGKLLLKLSIPTVIAQLINMLYNYCRPYLYRPHPGGRQSGTYRCGSLYAHHHDRLRICGTGQFRRRTKGFYLYGENRTINLLRIY